MNKKAYTQAFMAEQVRTAKVLIIVSAVLIFAAVISASALMQKYESILVALPTIIVTVIAMSVNIAYWIARNLEVRDKYGN